MTSVRYRDKVVVSRQLKEAVGQLADRFIRGMRVVIEVSLDADSCGRDACAA
jgi:hypothetical protein